LAGTLIDTYIKKISSFEDIEDIMSSLTDINLVIDTIPATAARQGQGQVSQGAHVSKGGGNAWLYWWVESWGIHRLVISKQLHMQADTSKILLFWEAPRCPYK